MASVGKNIGTGASIGAAAGSVVPGVGTAIGGAVGTLGGAVASLFGGGGGSGCDKDTRQKKNELTQRIQQLLTPSEMDDLTSGMENPQHSASQMADFFYGGHDCKHKNVTSGDQRFLDRLPQMLKRKARQADRQQQQQSSGSSGSSGSQTPSASTPTGAGGFQFDSTILWIGGMLLAVVGIFAFSQ